MNDKHCVLSSFLWFTVLYWFDLKLLIYTSCMVLISRQCMCTLALFACFGHPALAFLWHRTSVLFCSVLLFSILPACQYFLVRLTDYGVSLRSIGSMLSLTVDFKFWFSLCGFLPVRYIAACLRHALLDRWIFRTTNRRTNHLLCRGMHAHALASV
jgi:hypothetical protein